MEEEEEDQLLLTSLGVTSANPEEIERDILVEVNYEAGSRSEIGNSIEGKLLEEEQGAGAVFASRAKLRSKLRAVEVEIDAVATSVYESNTSVNIENELERDAEDDNDAAHVSANGLALQRALAADRLRSLKKTRDQLQRELISLEKDSSLEDFENDGLLRTLVEEEPEHKPKLKRIQKPGKDPKKRRKNVAFDDDVDFDAVLDAASAGLVETERDELIRKGILTPFHKLKGFERRLQQPGPLNNHNASEESMPSDIASTSIAKAAKRFSAITQARPTTQLLDADSLPKLEPPTQAFQRLKRSINLTGKSGDEKSEKHQGDKLRKSKRPLPDKFWRKAALHEEKLLEGSGEAVSGSHHRPSSGAIDSVDSDFEVENQEEVEDQADNEPATVTIEGGLKIPEAIFNKLFDYQKVGVQWLWELHCQRAGGIIGDEMGLGKTIQVISFLAALHFSKMYKPSIVICPVTLLRQWRREIRKWYPKFHVDILHDSARDSAYKQKQVRHDETDKESEGSLDVDNDNDDTSPPAKTSKKWDYLINRVLRSESGLLITTYEQLRVMREKLLDIEWGYAVLDEGHRIRNPNAEVTLVCKQLQTVHRIIMTGAPIQNKLTELWSLFDFAFPGKLGVLPVFEAQFSVPISIGGYANATPLQVSTAYRCAVVLRDLVMPYLLRRVKADVNAQLPKKTEHVLFCSLTSEQRSVYRAFLASSEVEQIFDGSKNSLYGIDVMRKICNHPDLLERQHSSGHPDYGNAERSGKLKVVAQVLKVWKEQGHRVLLFTQTQQMLDILENFLVAGGYVYRRMDGLTPVKQRMTLMDEFNNSTHIFIFILTARVGGLGTNLTGANRVIIFDPDWNPSTDMQARERAWRIGQTRDVTIYRLITRGTIEEKIYHRQIYKHFLTNKILKNPQQRRFFKARDMRDLFQLQDNDAGSTETSNIFSQLAGEVNVDIHGDNQDKQELTTVTNNRNASISEGAGSSKSGTSHGKGKVDQSDGEADEESNMLRGLFEAHGIHSAMNHDVIMNANDEEKMRLEEEASQVAQRAAEALRQSRMLRSRESVSVPTWTGRAGTAGAPSSVRKKFGSTVNTQLIGAPKPYEGTPASKSHSFAAGASTGKALSSKELLARIRNTQVSAIGAGLEHQLGSISGSQTGVQSSIDARSSSASRAPSMVQPEVLIRQLCTFIQQKGGSTSSATVVEHFKDKIPSKDLSLFKNLLKQIATLEKETGGSLWVLKPEYQQ